MTHVLIDRLDIFTTQIAQLEAHMVSAMKAVARIEREQKRISRAMGIGGKKSDMPAFPITKIKDFRELEDKIKDEPTDSPFLLALVRRSYLSLIYFIN